METKNEEKLHLEKIHDLLIQLQGLRQCYNVMRKHGGAIQKAVTAFELSFGRSNSTELNKSMNISESCVLFGVAAHALINNCDIFLNAAQSELSEVYKAIKKQKSQIENLEEMVRAVANGQTEMKNVNFSCKLVDYQSDMDMQSVASIPGSQYTQMDYSEDEFRSDTLKYLRQTIHDTLNVDTHRISAPEIEVEAPYINSQKLERNRRSTIPDKPNVHFSAWNFLKTAIGKDLSKIPVPVNFNEPLTMLQRITEVLEFSHLLDSAAEIDDKCRQLAYVAAFSIASYACNDYRTGKPFNPLLHETYECDRTVDMGWRSIAEQVSHHPPISAVHCEGRGWIYWQEISLSSKFKGKTLQFDTFGSIHCKFLKTGNTYSWGKVPTVVKNIVVGTMWLDHFGHVDILGLDAASGLYCELTYEPYSLFSSGPQRRVHGVIKDEDENAKLLIKANWDLQVEIAPVLSTQKTTRVPKYETGDYENIWTRVNFEQRTENTYYFSKFTCELNELEEGVAPTDSRLRPDLRLMEQGLWEQSNIEKLRLEENQRAKRKRKSLINDGEGEEGEPVWFKRENANGKSTYRYKHTYWDAKLEQDWSQCPNIF